MKKYIISKEKNQYKADLHSHTICSDGAYTPMESKALHKERGFSVVAFTDHDIFLTHNDLTDNDFIALNGFELTVKPSMINEYESKKRVHLCFIAEDSAEDKAVSSNSNKGALAITENHIDIIEYIGDFQMRKNEPAWLNEAIRKGNESGFLVTYNHPDWSLVDANDYLPLEGLFAMEVYNAIPWGTIHENYTHYLQMLRAGKHVKCLATNDFHYLDCGWNALQGATYICTDDFSYNGIIDALKSGDFYCSSGVTIREMYIEGDRLHIECSPVKSACLIGEENILVRKWAEKGELLTNFDLELAEYCKKYFQLVLIDEKGDRAWSNPVFEYEKFMQ